MYDIEPIRIAIVKRAVGDYRIALRTNNLHRQKKLEKFFLSGWGQLLSYGRGQYIIEQCKKITRKK